MYDFLLVITVRIMYCRLKLANFSNLRLVLYTPPFSVALSKRRHSVNKNLAIANTSRVSCAHNMSKASMITP